MMHADTMEFLPDLGKLAAFGNEETPGYRDRVWYPVPVHERATAESQFAKLAKRATQKLGADAPRLVWHARGQYEVRTYWKDEDGAEHSRARWVPCYFGAIEGTRPKLAGWNLAARMLTLGTGERVTRNVPGVEVPERVRALHGSTCEHCGTSRVRRDVFIVHNADTAEFKQVGRTCLRDFLGHDPSKILDAWNAIESLEQSGGEFLGAYYTAPMFDSLDVLALAACVIRVDGWTPKSMAGETRTSTAGIVGQLLHVESISRSLRTRYDVSLDGGIGALSDADKESARRTLAWVRAIDAKSDYERNLVASLKHESMDSRTLGVVCSAVSAYFRAMSREAELNIKRKLNAESGHVGAEKQRLRDVPATIEAIRPMESDFGVMTLYKLRDDSGNLFSWFRSGGADLEDVPGARVLLTGTVKSHKEYKGVKETQLSRCKLAPLPSTTKGVEHMPSIFAQAIDKAYPGAIREGDGKGFTRPAELQASPYTPEETRGWYWTNTIGDRFYFETREECAEDLANDIGMNEEEARSIVAGGPSQ